MTCSKIACAPLLAAVLFVGGCFINGGDDDDHKTCVTDCDHTHGSCTADCDKSDNSCVVACDGERDSCTKDCN